eukprot:CAMPEP_0197665414 /NCGR_PEP_ID=MMETSP1338-20131121/59214_1 /TAXON_ID=43686 ORGANISM="Pelagodinium beii, Strain RCC1491" /NCGR_SAMPLE_ID=MMETSP1338 /ASSEMBLY_ACC=CAM_ASM_000754 /LENGTH=194 /DNA_ID=CAMNT_0043244217 /DNA_START=107 /DNA_END=691 /DNA_ORIENTATION=-
MTLVTLLGPTAASGSFQETLCASVNVPGFCPKTSTSSDDSESSSTDSCETSPDSCCKDSTCSSMPGLGCWAKRGDTECVGQKLLPPSLGKCMCDSGYCGTDGVCTPSASSIKSGASGSTFTGEGWTGSSPGRLYEQTREVLPPEDHRLALLAYASAFAGMVAASFPVAKRFRTRGGRNVAQGLKLLAQDSESPE